MSDDDLAFLAEKLFFGGGVILGSAIALSFSAWWTGLVVGFGWIAYGVLGYAYRRRTDRRNVR